VVQTKEGGNRLKRGEGGRTRFIKSERSTTHIGVAAFLRGTRTPEASSKEGGRGKNGVSFVSAKTGRTGMLPFAKLAALWNA